MGAARAKRQNIVMLLKRQRGPLDSLAVLLKAAQNPMPMARSRRPKNFAIDRSGMMLLRFHSQPQASVSCRIHAALRCAVPPSYRIWCRLRIS
jgi:hypothetical protein